MKHTVTFKFSGLLADEHEEIRGSEHAAYTEAAKRLLGVQAHTYTTGRVPHAARDHTSEYEVRHKVTQSGCVEDVWSVTINNPWMITAIGVIGAAFAPDIRSAIYSFKDFLRDSLSAVTSGRAGALPHLPRIEPTLDSPGPANHPFIDIASEEDEQRRKLHRLTSRVLHDCAKPIAGRSASIMSISCDGSVLIKLDARALRELIEREITIYTDEVKAHSRMPYIS